MFHHCSLSENLALFTITSIHNVRKSTKHRNSETRWKVTDRRMTGAQSSNRSKDREIELINKEVWKKRKEKKRFSIEEIDSYIMWKLFNTVPNELVSYQNRLLCNKPSYCHKVVSNTFRLYCCQWWMKYTSNLSWTNYQTPYSYPISSFIRSN